MPTLALSPARRDLAISAVLLLAAGALAALLAAHAPLGVDYSGPARTFCDCPGTPIRALAHGRVHEFFATQPVMGAVSLVVRAPFALLGLHLTRGSELDLYRFGAFPCLLAAGMLGVYVFNRMRELRRPALARLLCPVLIAINPLTALALRFGHPEEMLAATLCVAAVLAAGRRRSLLAGVLLGAAVATKQWALLAALPVLAAADEERGRLALAAACTAALFFVPMAAGDFSRLVDANHGAGVAGAGVMPTNIWFGFGSDVTVFIGAHGATTPPRALPGALGAISHPLILTSGFAVGLLWWRRGRAGAQPEDALLVVALIMLIRCLLDPMTNGYYHLPFLMSLAAWEALRRRGAPVLTVVATLLLAFTMALAKGGVDAVVLNRFYLAWTLPLAGLLAAWCFAPGLRAYPSRSAHLDARG